MSFTSIDLDRYKVAKNFSSLPKTLFCRLFAAGQLQCCQVLVDHGLRIQNGKRFGDEEDEFLAIFKAFTNMRARRFNSKMFKFFCEIDENMRIASDPTFLVEAISSQWDDPWNIVMERSIGLSVQPPSPALVQALLSPRVPESRIMELIDMGLHLYDLDIIVMIAVERGSHTLMSLSLEAGTEVHVADAGEVEGGRGRYHVSRRDAPSAARPLTMQTPERLHFEYLREACRFLDRDTLNVILKHGANPKATARDGTGHTALWWMLHHREAILGSVLETGISKPVTIDPGEDMRNIRGVNTWLGARLKNIPSWDYLE
ncbi:hypothetical protein B0T19DRAFT_436640 [Cercophora scortea]|uniref:Ankyrin repeat protein n=1 Tax=Cercophora scortea TaxID=314031 RepID=A0AAE0J2R6_9PEZI|nr:hypothetical protein B0T19DRAFT_436640 [Cercophora scortea]